MKKPRNSKHAVSRRTVMKGSLMAAALRRNGHVLRSLDSTTGCGRRAPSRSSSGLTCDASGQYGNSGQDDVRGIRLAIDEFNAKGGVLGRKIEWITADTETNPATGTRVAERFIAQDQCGFLIGAVHSGVANAITQVANKYGTVYLNTNSSAPSEAGENCSRVKFVWDGNGTNFSKAAVQNAVEKIGKKLAAAHQRLRVGPHHLGGHQGAGGEGRRADHRQPADPAEHARLRLLSAEGAAGQARRGGDRRRRRRHQGAAPAGERPQARGQGGLDQQPAGLAGHLGRARDAVRRVRHHLVSLPAAAGRRGVRQALADRLSAVADPGAGQRLLQRLHGDARAAARHRAGGLDQQPQGHQGARRPQDVGGGPHAALRCLHRSGHAPGAADHLSGAPQYQAEGQDRPVRDPQLDEARERAGRCGAGQVQAEARRRGAELRDCRVSLSPSYGERVG